MIVRIERHPRHPGLCLAHTHPDMREVMGHFRPARYSPDDRGYLLDDNDETITNFARLLAHHGHQIADERNTPANAPTQTHVIADPLPECAGCGQPRRRHHAPPAHCPGCGRAWVDADPTRDQIRHTPTRPCPACGAHEKGAFAHCSRCGAAMGRPKLTVLAGLLPQDPPRALRPPSEPATVGEHLGDLW